MSIPSSSKNIYKTLLPFLLLFLLPSPPPPPLPLPLLLLQVQQSAAAICQGGSHGLEQLLRVMSLLDLAVDTFEYPYGNVGE